MSVLIHCDGPECEQSRSPYADDLAGWLHAHVEVSAAERCCDTHGVGWQPQNAAHVHACRVEHLRAAIALRIAELTDLPQAT